MYIWHDVMLRGYSKHAYFATEYLFLQYNETRPIDFYWTNKYAQIITVTKLTTVSVAYAAQWLKIVYKVERRDRWCKDFHEPKR